MGFDCGHDSGLTEWLNRQAHVYVNERLCNVWVLTTKHSPETVYGYFTLASHQILVADVTKRHRNVSGENGNIVASLPAMPTQLLGKFAIDQQYQGTHLSSVLMHYVYEKFVEATQASAAKYLVLETNRKQLVQFYEKKHGFTRSPSNEPGKLTRMYKRAADIEDAYARGRQIFSQN